MTELKVLAAGSLRPVWQTLMESFQQQSGIRVQTDFGPAGLLRQRIEAGETVDLFASANHAHPQRLLAQGLAQRVEIFTRNRLCLTARKERLDASATWLDLLRDPRLTLGTSTPLADPSGDYTWQLFDNIDKCFSDVGEPGLGELLRNKAKTLVGGPESTPIPAGELAADWLIRSGQCDLFIGYASYARCLEKCTELRVLDIAEEYNVPADYAFAQCHARAAPLSEFLLTTAVREYLETQGYSSKAIDFNKVKDFSKVKDFDERV